MKRNKGNQRKSTYSRKTRLMAVVLALTLAFTSSGFTSLAEDIGEGNADSSVVTVEAQDAAAEQAAAEAAAAEQAAAEAAAAEQAAAEAAAAEQAAAEAAAAEAAAAEAAAAEQAAAEEAASAEEQPEDVVIEVEELPETAGEIETADEEVTETESEEETESLSVIYRADDGDIYVTVEAPENALPDDAVLKVKYYKEDTDEYKEAAKLFGLEEESEEAEEPEEDADAEEAEEPEEIEEAADEQEEAAVPEEAEPEVIETTVLKTLDIYFESEGQKIEPAEDVSVKIDVSRIITKDQDADKKTMEAWHCVTDDEGKPVALLVADIEDKSKGTVDTDKCELEFDIDSLQRFAVTWTDKTVQEMTEAETEAEAEEAALPAVKMLEGSNDYEYEDEFINLQIHVSGDIELKEKKEAAAEEEEAQPDEAAGEEAGEAAPEEAEEPAEDVPEETAEEDTGAEELAARIAAAAEAAEAEEAVPEEDVDEAAYADDAADEYTDEEPVAEEEPEEEIFGTPEVEVVTWDEITMEVTFLKDTDASYEKMETYSEEEESGRLQSLMAVKLSFYYGDTQIDVTGASITAEITPTEKFISAFSAIGEEVELETEIVEEDAAEEEENEADEDKAEGEEEDPGFFLYVLEAVDEDVNELDSAEVEDEEELPTFTVSLNPDGSFGIMVLSDINPGFTVQFYANLDTIYRTHQEGDTDLTVIETHTESGAVLPQNGTTPATSVIELKSNGSGYIMDSENVLTQMYADEKYDFVDEYDIHHMNKLENNSDYELVEVWVLKDGKDSDSIDEEDWDIYDCEREKDGDGNETITSPTFTNHENSADDSTIYLKEGAVLRFVYDTTESDAQVVANFYDYNIGDGFVYNSASTSGGLWDNTGNFYLYTYMQGINNSANYSDSGAKYAFGNENTGTGLGSENWNGSTLNKSGTGYNGCTFGLVNELNGNTVSFSSGIDAPNIFGDGGAVGKQTISGANLIFSREGDTYTLTGVSGDKISLSNLDTFTNPGNYNTIYTNNFWPLDNISYTGMDPLFGSNMNTQRRFGEGTSDGALPASDDGTDHNSYFGMNYDIEFNLTEDYVGPLEYFFFGDDDMWVFLDDTLVLDIGGVHSSVGEHVDLWDYLDKGTAGTHTLSIFYTERGASGSTCYISYTLPTVSSVTPVEGTGNLIVRKEVEGSTDQEDEDFTFTIDWDWTKADGHANEYYGLIFNSEGEVTAQIDNVLAMDSFTLKDGYYLIVFYLPVGTSATVKETNGDNYFTTWTIETGGAVTQTDDGKSVNTGGIAEGDTTRVTFVNTRNPQKDVDVNVEDKKQYDDNGVLVEVGQTLTYKISYINSTGETADVTITDKLDPNVTYVEGSASGNGEYDPDTHTITWTITGVESRASGEVTFQVVVLESALQPGAVENTATVKIGNDWKSDTNTVKNPVPKKSVETDYDPEGENDFDDNHDLVNIGDTLTYKITYENAHDSRAVVTITDTLDPGVEYVEGSASDEGVYDEETRTVTWELIAEPYGKGEVTFQVIVTGDAVDSSVTDHPGRVENTASVKVGNDAAVNTNTVENPVPQKSVETDYDPDGENDFDDDDVLVGIGDTLTYKISFANHDDDPQTVVITDELDPNVEYVENSATQDGVYDAATHTITWTIPDVESGAEGEVLFQVVVTGGTIKDDTGLGYVENSAVVKVGNHPDVETNKVENPVPLKGVDTNDDREYDDDHVLVAVGQTVEYRVSYYNHYDTPQSVTITDVLDKNVKYISSDPAAVYDSGTHTLTWTIENVPAQTEGSVTFKVEVLDSVLDPEQNQGEDDHLARVENDALVKIGNDAEVRTNLVENPVVEKSVETGFDVDTDFDDYDFDDNDVMVGIGQIVMYKITYRNDFDEPADVIITDELDPNVAFVYASEESEGTTAVYDSDTHTVTWTIKNVPAQTEGFVILRVRVLDTVFDENGDHPGWVENTAGVQVGNHPSVETNKVENPVPQKEVSILPNEGYDDDGNLVKVGDILEYKITYRNDLSETQDIKITDTLDENVKYVENSASDGGIYDEGTRTITWNLIHVGAGTEGSVTFQVEVLQDALIAGDIENTAKVKIGNYPEITTNTVENPVPQKGVDTDRDGKYDDDHVMVAVGQTIEYKVTYYNHHDTAATVVITDALDPNVEFVSASDGGVYDADTHTITWTLEDVAAGEDGAVTFEVTVLEDAMEPGRVENTASVKIGNDAEVTTNTVENPVPEKDVDVDITDEKDYDDNGVLVAVGQTLTYKITYRNDFDKAATVVITDELDENVSFVKASDNGVYDEATHTVTWTLEEVPAGTESYVTFQVVVLEGATEPGMVANGASVMVGDHPAVDTNVVENPVPEKDVDVDTEDEKQYDDNGVPVEVGQTLTYKITYRNGHDDARDILITDALDKNVEYVEESATESGVYDPDTHTITWKLEGVEAGAEGTVEYKVVVLEGARKAGKVENSAIVEVERDPAVETVPMENPLPEKDVDVNLDDSKDYGDNGVLVAVGQTLTYKVTYKNSHDEAANVVITDTLDENVEYVADSASDKGDYNEATRTVTWTLKDVPAGAEGYVTFQVVVLEGALEPGLVENTASVKVGNDAAVNTNTVENPVPEKSVEVHDDEEEAYDFDDNGELVAIGSTVTYKITYYNDHDTEADVIITDVLKDTTYTAGTTKRYTVDEDGNAVEAESLEISPMDSKNLKWTFRAAPYEKGYITFDVVVDESALVPGLIENTGRVQIGEDHAVDTNPVENPVPKKSVDTDADDAYDDDGDEVEIGQTLEYKITYRNDHDEPATVTIVDHLDENVAYVDGTASNGGVYDEGTHTITWTLEDVAAHTENYVVFKVTVLPGALKAGSIENTATAKVGNDAEVTTNTVENPVPGKSVETDYDPDAENDFDDNGVLVEVGQTLTYRIVFQNEHDTEQDVVITDALDPNVEYVEDSASNGGTYDPETHTITWKLDHVSAHTEGSVTFQVVVLDSALVPGEVENTAKVKVGNDAEITTNTVENPVPQKGVDTDGDGEYDDDHVMVAVGQEIEYKVTYYNHHDTDATVVITDALDENVAYVEDSASDGGKYDADTHTIIWTLEDVPAGEDGAVTFKVVVLESAMEPGRVENTASVKIGNDAEVTTNTVENPVPEKDVDVDITDEKDYDDNGVLVAVGQTLTYKITYRNDFDKAATVVITDELDENVSFVKASDGGVYDESSHTVTWTLENVSAGTESYVTFQVVVLESATEPGKVVNGASVKVGDHPAVDTNVVENPVPEKDVDVNTEDEKQYDDNGVPVEVGQTLTYKITYRNGHEDARDILITDALDENVEYVENSASAGGEYDPDTHTITWKLKGVGAGTEGTVEYKVVVLEGARKAGKVENSAIVEVDRDPAVETVPMENPLPEKDVDVNLDDSKDYGDNGVLVAVGQTLTYKVTYKNSHDEAADVVITDALDENVEYVADSASDKGDYNEATRTVTWTLKDVPAGAEGYVTFQVVVLEGALEPGLVENTASVKVGNDAAVNTNTVENPVPEKSVEVHDDEEEAYDFDDNGELVAIGSTVTYKITYYNDHDTEADVIITDVLKDTTYTAGTTKRYTVDEDGNAAEADEELEAATADSKNLKWTFKAAPYEKGYITFDVVVDESALVPGLIENTGRVQIGEDHAVDTNPVENPVPKKSVDTDADDAYDDDGDEVEIGQTLEYKITYSNDHDEAATVIIVDHLDENVAYVDGTASSGGVYDEGTHTITWTLEDVPAHTENYVVFKVTVLPGALKAGSIENTATAKVGNDAEVTTNTVENPVPQKGVDTDGDGEYDDNGVLVEVGQTLTYRIVFQNEHDTEQDVVITDTLDPNVKYVEGSASNGGSYDPETHTITWKLDHVSAHREGSVTFQVVVLDSALVPGKVENTAKVKVGNDAEVTTNTVENPVPQKGVDTDGDGVYDDDHVMVAVGQTIEYRVTYYNHHDTVATVVITDALDENVEYVEGSASEGGEYDADTHTITWTLEEVPAETDGYVTFQVTVLGGAMVPGRVENTAKVRVGNDAEVTTNTVENPVPEKDVDTDEDRQYEDDGEWVTVGDTLTYKITYRNDFDSPATVVITDELDPNVQYVDGSASDGGEYDADTHTITWTLEEVPAETENYVTFRVVVLESATDPGRVVNDAKVKVGDHPAAETNPVENPVYIDIPVEKTWDDSDDVLELRPEEIQVQLYRDGEPVAEEDGGILTLNEDNDWSGVFTNLPTNENGETITYTVEELPFNRLGKFYVSTVEGDIYRGFTINNTLDINFYPLDEEIVTDPDGDMFNKNESYVKSESVNEWTEVEIEISTTLPKISGEDLMAFSYTMLFHDQLSLELNLDDAESDFSVYINETEIDPDYYEIVFDSEDGCNFEVNVDLSALYRDEVITEEDLDQALIQIFFWADLENAEFGDDHHYTSTTWYQVYVYDEEADEQVRLYESNVDVVYFYTLRINILKYDESVLEGEDYEGAALAGAIFGIYYDEKCTDPVIRYSDPINEVGEAYTDTSGEDGSVTFIGLAEGTYYVKELQAPNGYVLSDDVIKVELVDELGENVYDDVFANEPYIPTKSVDSDKDKVFEDDGKMVQVGDMLTYEITYQNCYNETADITITDVLDKGLDFESADNKGYYDSATRTITWTIRNVPAGAEGSVSFKATVNEDALEAHEVDNTASVKVGDNPAVSTNTVENPVPEKQVDTDGDKVFDDNGVEVQVDDVLTYKIIYKNGHDTAEDVTITDVLDKGLDFMSADNGGTYDASTRMITWTISDVPAGAEGYVTFKAKVNETGLSKNLVENTASVQIGTDPAVNTNRVENPVVEEPEEPETSTPGTTTPQTTTGTGSGSGTSGSGSSEDTGSSASSVQTGDETPVGMMVGLMAAALVFLLGGAGYFVYRRRRASR